MEVTHNQYRDTMALGLHQYFPYLFLLVIWWLLGTFSVAWALPSAGYSVGVSFGNILRYRVEWWGQSLRLSLPRSLMLLLLGWSVGALSHGVAHDCPVSCLDTVEPAVPVKCEDGSIYSVGTYAVYIVWKLPNRKSLWSYSVIAITSLSNDIWIVYCANVKVAPHIGAVSRHVLSCVSERENRICCVRMDGVDIMWVCDWMEVWVIRVWWCGYGSGFTSVNDVWLLNSVAPYWAVFCMDGYAKYVPGDVKCLMTYHWEMSERSLGDLMMVSMVVSMYVRSYVCCTAPEPKLHDGKSYKDPIDRSHGNRV